MHRLTTLVLMAETASGAPLLSHVACLKLSKCLSHIATLCLYTVSNVNRHLKETISGMLLCPYRVETQSTILQKKSIAKLNDECSTCLSACLIQCYWRNNLLRVERLGRRSRPRAMASSCHYCHKSCPIGFANSSLCRMCLCKCPEEVGELKEGHQYRKDISFR